MPPVDVQPPQTPPPVSPHTLRDSPFSDYWTDASFSPDPNHPHSFESHPSQRPLLQRINSIGAQIVRVEPCGRVADILGQKLDALEAVLAAPETRSRMPAELEDSGLFLEDDEVDQWDASHDGYESEEQKQYQERPGALDEKASASSDEEIPSRSAAEFADPVNADLNQLLARVTTTQEALRRRYDEVKHINELVSEKLEHTIVELTGLRDTNTSLISTLELNRSELVFLKLQLQNLEQTIPTVTAAVTNLSSKSDTSISTMSTMKAWRTEANRWKYNHHDVKQRFARRSAAHGIRAEPPRENPSADDLSFGEIDGFRDDDARSTTPRPEMGQRAMAMPLVASSAGGGEDEHPTNRDAVTSERRSNAASNGGLLSAWGAFWESLADAAGVLDYGKLLYEEHDA